MINRTTMTAPRAGQARRQSDWCVARRAAVEGLPMRGRCRFAPIKQKQRCRSVVCAASTAKASAGSGLSSALMDHVMAAPWWTWTGVNCRRRCALKGCTLMPTPPQQFEKLVWCIRTTTTTTQMRTATMMNSGFHWFRRIICIDRVAHATPRALRQAMLDKSTGIRLIKADSCWSRQH